MQPPRPAEHSGPSVTLYLVIFGCLILLTGLTVGVSRIQMPAHTAVILAFLIAISKASLVLAFFMHLKYESKVLHLVCLIPTILTVILVLALVPDVGMMVLLGPGGGG